MPSTLIAAQVPSVNSLAKDMRKCLKTHMSRIDPETMTEREMEQWAAALGAEVGAMAFRAVLEQACMAAALADLAVQGLSAEEVRWRHEPEYHCTVRSTLGAIPVCLAAYRHRTPDGGWRTRVPARGKVVARRKTRSSTLALEWESKVAALHPFRKGAGLLRFFSRGKLTVEDNSIARHTIAIGLVMKRHWKYATPTEIVRVLQNEATRDRKTGRPLLYFSSDAHSIRQYEDETWSAPWKNVNGVRLWCQDRKTGGIIHLGGDFTVGDCKEVERLVVELRDLGILPANCVYGDGVRAQLVVITDGAHWLLSRLKDVLPEATWLIDAYHAHEYLNDYAASLYGKGSTPTRRHYATLVELLTGRPPKQRRARGRPRNWRPKHPRRKRTTDYEKLIADGFGIDSLIAFLEGYQVDPEREAVHEAFIERLRTNRTRMDYLAARARGMQIGSGAMESLHRNGSQLRLKLPGARWRPEAAQAMLNHRALELVGRWGEFWSHENLPELLDEALGHHQPRVRRAA